MVKIESILFYKQKMFVKIPYKELEVGKKYKIVGQCEYTGIYQKPLFSNVKSDYYYGYMMFSPHTDFYELVPQANMERRAVNMILRKLIGDDCFEW